MTITSVPGSNTSYSPHAASTDNGQPNALTQGKPSIRPASSFKASAHPGQSPSSIRHKREAASQPSTQGDDRLENAHLNTVFDGLVQDVPPSPRQAAHDFAADYLKKRNIQGDPDQIFFTTHFPSSESVPGGYDKQVMSMTDMVMQNRQWEFTDSSYGLVHSELCGPDGKPIPGLDRADFQKHIWDDNFAQIYIDRINAYFAKNRDPLIYSMRAGIAKNLTRQVVGGSVSPEGAGVVSRGLGTGKYVDWNQRELDHFTHPKPDGGVEVRPLKIDDAVSNQAMLFIDKATGKTVMYLPGNTRPFHEFKSQDDVGQWFLTQVVQGDEETQAQFRSYFPDDTVEFVDKAYKNLADHPERIRQGDYFQPGFAGDAIQGDTVTTMVDQLQKGYLTQGHEQITSDEQWGRQKAIEWMNVLGMVLMPLQFVTPGIAIALGIGQMGVGIDMVVNGNSQERENGRKEILYGLLNAAEGGKDAFVTRLYKRPRGPRPSGTPRIRRPTYGERPSGPHGSKNEVPSALDTRIQRVSDNGRVRSRHVTTEGNHVTGIQVGGDAIFDSQAQLIRQAQHEVLIQTFAWDPTSPGAQKILDALMELPPGQRVKVRLLVDESAGPAKKFMQWTSNNPGAGGRWPSDPDALIGNYKHDPNFKYRALLDKVDFEVRVHQHGGANAMHGKMVIVDNRYAATTGANVQSRNHGQNPAYDMGVTLEGPAAEGMRDAFVYNWNKSVNPDQKTNALPQDYEFAPRQETVPSGTGQRVSVVTRSPNANPLVKSVENPQNQAFLGAIEGARREIWVMTPNLNADAAIDALAKAADRGVKVHIIVSKEFNDARVGQPFGGGTNADTIAKLKARTKHPENMDVRYFQNPGAPDGAAVPSGNAAGNGASHVKLLLVDGEVAIVGSANMDNASWYYAGELNLLFRDKSTAEDLFNKVVKPAWERSPQV